MILSLVVIVLVGVIAWVWASRGFFSALVHLVCTVVAGAVAFGVWEPLAYLILQSNVPSWVVDMAWGVSLGVPFAVTLAVLRLAVDKALPANADLDGTTNLIGGGVCGAISGTIAIGILIISMTFLRLPSSIMGFDPIAFETNGSPKRDSKLLFPVDQLTAGMYSFMSTTTLRTGSPMATWRPSLADEGYLLRKNFNQGSSRNTMKPDAFKVLGRYTVGEAGNLSVRDLTSDSFPPERPQTVTRMDGSPAAQSSYVEGFVVQFKPGAKEKEGRVVVGNAQVRLVCVPANDPDGEAVALHPFAMVSQAEGDRLDLGRWRFERPEIFIASVGGAAEANMAFEFLVPRGYQPLALYVKGIRTVVQHQQAFQRFTDTRARDAAIRTGTIISALAAGGGQPVRSQHTVTIDPASNAPDNERDLNTASFLPRGIILVKDKLAGLEVDEDGRIISGEAKFRNNDLSAHRGIERRLQVREVAATDDTKIVQVRVGNDSRIGLGTAAALNVPDPNQPPVLIDDQGQRYWAMAYVYIDNSETHISVRPGQPIRAYRELPFGGPTPSRPDQKFYLLYRVSRGVNLKYFAIGDAVIGEFNPTLPVDAN